MAELLKVLRKKFNSPRIEHFVGVGALRRRIKFKFKSASLNGKENQNANSEESTILPARLHSTFFKI